MASNKTNLPYPFQFDPSQWANPYTQWNKQALPFMGQYAGVPTDARGNPIQSYVDAQTQSQAAQAAAAAPPAQAPPTTLNSNPLTQATGPGGLNREGLNPNAYGLGAQSGASPMNPSGNAALFAANWGGFMPTSGQWGGAQQQAAPAPVAPAAPAGPDMNAAYLQALSNPGRIATPGATVPQSAPPSNQSGVLQQFLANWQNKGAPTQGAGNYNNKGFFDALQGNV